MDLQPAPKRDTQLLRQLASLKILSRLLGHELHAQGGAKTIQLSRDEVVEIQTTVDLYIEDLTRRQVGSSGSSNVETPLVTARN